jgi:ABC-type nitrate/sulfonate/bicarbonate transport system substrate-binding protein
MKRFNIKLVILILAISFLLNCFAFAQEVDAKSKVLLRVGYLPALSQLPLIVSYENNGMTMDSVTLKLDRYNSYNSLEAALRVGAIDVASIPVPIALSIAADGYPIKIIGTMHRGGASLMAKTEGDFETLKGKLIGVPGLDSDENLKLSQVLSAANLRPGLDYKTIGVPFNTVIHDLKTNRLDAIYLPEPYGTIAKKEKLCDEVKGQKDHLAGTFRTVLVIQEEIMKKNKAAVKEWLVSLKNSCRFIEDDISKSDANQTAIIQEAYFNFSKPIVIESLSNRIGGLKFDLSTPQRKKIKKSLEQASQMKMLTKSVNLDNLLSGKLMKQVAKKSKAKKIDLAGVSKNIE